MQTYQKIFIESKSCCMSFEVFLKPNVCVYENAFELSFVDNFPSILLNFCGKDQTRFKL